MLSFLMQNQSLKYIVTLIIGISVGVIFYPSKRVEEKVTKKYEQSIANLKSENNKELSKQQDSYNSLLKEYHTYTSNSESKISLLTTQISSLKNSKKTTYTKVVHPDGTVEIKKTSDDETASTSSTVSQLQQEYQQKIEEFTQKIKDEHTQKITEIQKDFSSKEESYKKTIEEMQKTKITSINEKHFGLNIGMLNDKTIFGNANMDIWGPIYIDLFTNMKSNSGVGIGVRF